MPKSLAAKKMLPTISLPAPSSPSPSGLGTFLSLSLSPLQPAQHAYSAARSPIGATLCLRLPKHLHVITLPLLGWSPWAVRSCRLAAANRRCGKKYSGPVCVP